MLTKQSDTNLALHFNSQVGLGSETQCLFGKLFIIFINSSSSTSKKLCNIKVLDKTSSRSKPSFTLLTTNFIVKTFFETITFYALILTFLTHAGNFIYLFRIPKLFSLFSTQTFMKILLLEPCLTISC